MRRVLMFLLVVLVFAFAVPSVSQGYTETTSGDTLIAEVTPSNPGVFEKVAIHLKSYGVDLERSVINWKLNGSLVKSGPAVKDFTFATGDFGSATVVEIEIPQSANNTKKVLTFRPALIDLVWIADNQVPYFYQGKVLATPGSQITVLALPKFIDQTGRGLKAEELIYRWEKDSYNLTANSGLGKDALSFIVKPDAGNVVRVTVQSADGQLAAEKTMLIPLRQPKLLFYENDPLLGILDNRALDQTFNLTRDEVSLVALPYHIAAKPPTFIWRLNGEVFTPGSGDPKTATFRRPEEGSGSAQASVEIQDAVKNQLVVGGITIMFNATKQPSF